jgi:hypothetical protein
MLLLRRMLQAQKAGNGEKVLSGKEAIADPAHGFEKHGLSRVVLNIAAQTNDKVVDGARVRVLAYAPHLFQ